MFRLDVTIKVCLELLVEYCTRWDQLHVRWQCIPGTCPSDEKGFVSYKKPSTWHDEVAAHIGPKPGVVTDQTSADKYCGQCHDWCKISKYTPSVQRQPPCSARARPLRPRPPVSGQPPNPAGQPRAILSPISVTDSFTHRQPCEIHNSNRYLGRLVG